MCDRSGGTEIRSAVYEVAFPCPFTITIRANFNGREKSVRDRGIKLSISIIFLPLEGECPFTNYEQVCYICPLKLALERYRPPGFVKSNRVRKPEPGYNLREWSLF
ncbi:hypothetical protein BMS3Abin14_01269 [bacterium BMS3Abin14]|nr:hypothetical protein BMS3Abin14_01269 [bacterium BMS3Abin14]